MLHALVLGLALFLTVLAEVDVTRSVIVRPNGSVIHETRFLKQNVNEYTHSQLTARADYWKPDQVADDQRWTKFIEKGQHFNCLMNAPDRGAGWLLKDTRNPPSAASEWTGDLIDARKTWYWHESTVNQDRDCNFDKKRLKDAFNGVGLSGGLDDNICYRIEHVDAALAKDPKAPKKLEDQKYKVGEKDYTATGGLYWFAMNHKGGAIIATNLETPLTGTKYNWPSLATRDQLPALRFTSEIFWGYWLASNSDPKNLRIFAAYNVVNDETSSLAARALTSNGHETLTPWPGVSFARASKEGKALIGSPLGSIVAHLLVGHKQELGLKWIKKVEVFTNDKRPDGIVPKFKEMHIFWHVENVPGDQVIDPEKEKEEEKSDTIQ